MNFDLDIKNYNKDDYFEIFDLDKNMNVTKTTVETKYKNLLNNIKKGNLEDAENKIETIVLQICNIIFRE